MGPSTAKRKDKYRKKVRSRTPDAVDYDELARVAEPDAQFGIQKAMWKERADTMYKVFRKDKKMSHAECIFMKFLYYNGGKVSMASYESKIAISNHYNWLRINPTYKEYYDGLKEFILDMVEESLIEGALGGDFPSQKFYLESQGKAKGYSKDQNISVNVVPTQFLMDFSGATEVVDISEISDNLGGSSKTYEISEKSVDSLGVSGDFIEDVQNDPKQAVVPIDPNTFIDSLGVSGDV